METAPDFHVEGFPEKREGSGSVKPASLTVTYFLTKSASALCLKIIWWRWYQLWNVSSSWFHLTLSPMGFDTSPSAGEGRLSLRYTNSIDLPSPSPPPPRGSEQNLVDLQWCSCARSDHDSCVTCAGGCELDCGVIVLSGGGHLCSADNAIDCSPVCPLM